MPAERFLPLAGAGLTALVAFGALVKAHVDVTWTLSGVAFDDGGTASDNGFDARIRGRSLRRRCA